MASRGKIRKVSREARIQPVPKSTEFAEGAIVRMRLENFVTYDSVDFVPGPHLNMIIGPNATGKSSIVCAICLGLGGKTSILGRAQQPSEFVKHGTQKATIEIQLYNPHGEDSVVKREISKNNTSTWTVNGRPANHKVVEELTLSRKIQVGNLCQFLPQDKVADFAKMTEQELLENTQKAIAIEDMYENHVKLKGARAKEKKLELDHNSLQGKLEREEAAHSQQKQEVKNYEERQLHLEKVKLLNSKKPWVEYEEQRLKFNAEKAHKEDMVKKLRRIREENAPLQRKLDKARSVEQKMNTEMARKQTDIKEHAKLAHAFNTDIKKKSEKQEEVQHQLSSKKEEEISRRKRLREQQEYLTSLQDQMTEMDGSENHDVGPLLNQVSSSMVSVSRSLTGQQQRGDELRGLIDSAKRDMTVVQNNLRQLQDLQNRRLEKLRSHNKDAYQAVIWLRANHHKFKAPIHEPLMMVLNLKDPKYAPYLESQVSYQDFFTFVCEDSSDQDLFLRNLRVEQDLRINSALLPTTAPTKFHPKKPISAYKSFGFGNYLREMFDCPEGVMRFLCLQYHVHSIPVGSDKTRQMKEAVIRDCPEFRTFFTEKHKNTVRQSKYGARNISTMCSALKNAQLLSLTADAGRENQLKQDMAKSQEHIKTLESESQQIKVSLSKFELELNELRTKKKQLTERKSMRRTLEMKIKSKEDSIKNLEAQALDLEAEEAAVKRRVRQIESEKIKVLLQLKDHTQTCLQLSMEKVQLSLRHATALREATKLDVLVREQSTAEQRLESDVKQYSEQVKETKIHAKQLLLEAKAAVNLKPNQELSTELATVFETLPDSVQTINEAIHDVQARADCTIHTDVRVVEEYRNREEAIFQLRRESRKLEQELTKHRKEIEEVKGKWLPPLQDLLARINKNYSEFFATMGCAGEVELSQPSNQEDYERYGIRIKVKFRDSEQLRELNAHHQSGGERSVATVLYMMALQELTKVPFRCVDEINQGMDPQNERRVFELVMKTCSKNTSQYFLLTPKLLPDLQYDEKLTIMCVVNGPNMMPHSDWSIKRFIRRKQRCNDAGY